MAEYTITRVIRTHFMDTTGLAVDGYRVFFTMDGGRSDYVEVSKARYNKANVDKAIKETIAVHVEVGD